LYEDVILKVDTINLRTIPNNIVLYYNLKDRYNGIR